MTSCLAHSRRGFTLVELLIVVVILGTLAGIAIPKFAVSTEDAKQSAVDSDQMMLEMAAERYRHQHGGEWPGARNSATGLAVTTAAEAEQAFVDQLTLHSDAGGITSNKKSEIFKYGPYLRQGIPKNPFNSSDAVTCDITETDISKAEGQKIKGTGWKFYIKTGRLIPNHEGKIIEIEGLGEGGKGGGLPDLG